MKSNNIVPTPPTIQKNPLQSNEVPQEQSFSPKNQGLKL